MRYAREQEHTLKVGEPAHEPAKQEREAESKYKNPKEKYLHELKKVVASKYRCEQEGKQQKCIPSRQCDN